MAAENKKIKSFSVSDEIYKKFQLQSFLIGKSVSKRIEEFMKECLDKEAKLNDSKLKLEYGKKR